MSSVHVYIHLTSLTQANKEMFFRWILVIGSTSGKKTISLWCLSVKRLSFLIFGLPYFTFRDRGGFCYRSALDWWRQDDQHLVSYKKCFRFTNVSNVHIPTRLNLCYIGCTVCFSVANIYATMQWRQQLVYHLN